MLKILKKNKNISLSYNKKFQINNSIIIILFFQ